MHSIAFLFPVYTSRRGCSSKETGHDVGSVFDAEDDVRSGTDVDASLLQRDVLTFTQKGRASETQAFRGWWSMQGSPRAGGRTRENGGVKTRGFAKRQSKGCLFLFLFFWLINCVDEGRFYKDEIDDQKD